MERRGRHPESWLWETEEGRRWLHRLMVATLYTFGFKRGVGVETLSEFFARLRLETQVGCSPSALRGVMEALAVTIAETVQVWEQDGVAAGEVREIIGAVDETFLEQMILVCQDVSTGYIVQEEVADDRTYATWKTLVDERLKALGTSVLYLVSDRAKALIQLAEQGFECLSMPDFFHFMHDIVKSYSLPMARQLKQAHQALTKATEALARQQGRPHAQQAAPEATAVVAARHAKVQQWEEVQHTYRHHLWLLCRCSVPIATVPTWCNTGNKPMGPSAIAATILPVHASFFSYSPMTKGGYRLCNSRASRPRHNDFQ